MRDETSWRDISSPGTMACEFFKVSLYSLIYDRWSVSGREKDSYFMYNTQIGFCEQNNSDKRIAELKVIFCRIFLFFFFAYRVHRVIFALLLKILALGYYIFGGFRARAKRHYV